MVTAPYAFFFHPHIRRSLYTWMGVPPERVDLIIDEAHNLPSQLRDLVSVALPQESVRRARSEVAERGDFQLPDGPSATRFFDIVGAAVEELVHALAREDDAVLPPSVFEDALLTALGGTSHRLDTWLGALATWGENLRDERRRERHLPRSWVHTVALTLLSWPQLEPPAYVKVATRSPRAALEAYSLDAAVPARPILECHTSVHLSGTLAPLEEYRDTLGLGESARLLDIPSHFPPEHRRLLYDPSVTTRFEDLRQDPHAIARLADRLVEVLACLPVKTAVFFPSFDLLHKVLEAGLQSSLPGNVFIEYSKMPTGDPWRSIEGWKRDPEGNRPARGHGRTARRRDRLPGRGARGGRDRGDPVSQADGEERGAPTLPGRLHRPRLRSTRSRPRRPERSSKHVAGRSAPNTTEGWRSSSTSEPPRSLGGSPASSRPATSPRPREPSTVDDAPAGRPASTLPPTAWPATCPSPLHNR